MKRILRLAGWTLIGATGVVLAFVVYQVFVTDLINARSQAIAAAQFEERLVEVGSVTLGTSSGAFSNRGGLLTELAVPEGEPFARMAIPKLAVDEIVFEGVGRDTLRLGPGHMPGTPLPGQPGNAVISGHRTTYGRAFSDLDELVVGDEIEIETALGVSVYQVREVFVVAPTDTWVAQSKPGAWLTLTTCHPQFSAAERLVVQAELVRGPNVEYVETMEASRELLTP